MSDCQEFPNTWEEFEQLYGFEDKKEIYTNGSRLIQSFRVKQWLDHTAEQEQKKGEWIDRMLYYDFDESEWEKVKRNIKKIKIRYCDADMKGE